MRLSRVFSYPFVLLILFYRKYLSHRKSWHCAYGALGYGTTCSTHGLMLYKTHNPITATRLMRKRFKQCKLAAKQYQKGDCDCGSFDCGDGIRIVADVLSGCGNIDLGRSKHSKRKNKLTDKAS